MPRLGQGGPVAVNAVLVAAAGAVVIWLVMLFQGWRSVPVQQIVAAIQAEARRHSSEDIYAKPETLSRMQAEIGSVLKERVNTVLGGEYFCGPTFDPEVADCPDFAFVIKEITLPENLQSQYHANRASALGLERAKAEVAQRQVEARGEAERQAALRSAPELTPGQLDYIRAQAQLECARRPDCVLVGAGAPVVVDPGNRRP